MSNQAGIPHSAYLEIIVHRVLARHQQVCATFEHVDPDTGLFLKNWEPRDFAQCQTPLHDEQGRLPDEDPQEEESTSER